MKARLTRIIATAILVMSPLAGAMGQVVENDLRLIADQSGAPPNLMILFDTSGSMRNIIWHQDFNPKIAYDDGASCTRIRVRAESGTSGECPGSGLSGGSCPDNNETQNNGAEFTCSSTAFSNGCTAWNNFPDAAFQDGECSINTRDEEITFKIPSLNGSRTLWSENYLSFLVRYMRLNGSLPADMPNETRIDGGKRVIEDLINTINPDDASTLGYQERVRFGMARLDRDGEGGYVVEPIADGNKASVISTLNSLPAGGVTPVSEALVDVARYFVGTLDPLGSYPAYNRTTSGITSSTSAPKSPLDPGILCRGNFIIVISDGDPFGDDHSHFRDEFDATFGEDYDKDGNTSISEDALDDVALYLFANDLIDDTIMPGDQNIITYTVGFSLDTELLRDTAINGDGAYFSVNTTDQLAETMVTAVEEIILRNATFTAASVPTSRSVFGDGFYTAFFEPRPSGELYRGHLQAYRIDDDFGIVGKDNKSALDPLTGRFVEPRDTFFWDAQETLKDPNNTRKIYFTPPNPGSDPNDFVPDNWALVDLGVTDADLTLYPNDPADPFADKEALSRALVSYVQGRDAFDEDRDTDKTELRDTVLGDIFHSNPQLVGQAQLLLAAEPGYGKIGDPSSFVEKYSEREKILYAGANDGMLHAFGAGEFKTGDNPATLTIKEAAYYTVGDGIEDFGYVPRIVQKNLKKLPLTGAKPYFVDGQITVADAWFPSDGADIQKQTVEWTSVLVSGLRNGGRGYFALDVTDPTALGTSDPHGPYPRFLWEFDGSTEPLGRTWSKAVITRVKLKDSFSGDYCGPEDGDGNAGVSPGNCREQWVAIFGGGYLEQGDPNISDQFLTDPNDPNWEDASKAIFMVALDTGKVLARAAYDDSDAQLKNMKFSFPSEPAVLDIDFDGFADLVYIGDTGGQMWKWDISKVGERPSSTDPVPLSTWPVGRFFTATAGSNGHRRNFFTPPSASLVSGKLVLAFGTGERTHLDYETTTDVDENQFYVVRDDTPTGTGSIPTLPYDQDNLTEVTTEFNDPDTTDQGFYFDGGEDEKFVSDSIIFGGFVITASYTPDLSVATGGGQCEARGDAKLYIFLVSDGTGYFEAGTSPSTQRSLSVGSGLPTSPSITVTKGNGSKVVLQTSDGRVITLDGPPNSINPVDVVYWKMSR